MLALAVVRNPLHPTSPSPIHAGTLPVQLRTKDPGREHVHPHHRPRGDDVVCHLGVEYSTGARHVRDGDREEVHEERRIEPRPRHLPHLPTYPSTHPSTHPPTHPLPPFLQSPTFQSSISSSAQRLPRRAPRAGIPRAGGEVSGGW